MKKMMKVATFVAMVLTAGFASCQEKIPDYLIVDGTTLTGYTDGMPANLVIPKGITKIADEAFEDCELLESVTIPKSVTAIGESAFYGCASLTNVTIPNGVTAIGECAFSDCASLTSVRIPGSVTEIGTGAFWGCESLTSVTIPKNVTEIGDDAFYGCEIIAVTYEGSLKDWCAVDWDSDLIEYAERIVLSDGTDLKKLTKITASDLAGVTKIGKYAFAGCDSLASVIIPSSVTTIGEDAFDDCDSLASVQYGGTKKQWEAIDCDEDDIGLPRGVTISCTDGNIRLKTSAEIYEETARTLRRLSR